MRKAAMGIGLAAILACSGCGGGDEGEGPEMRHERQASVYTAKDVDPVLVRASNGFGLSLVEKLMAERPEENVLLSPLSLSSALALVATGGGGGTEEEMRTVLGLGEKTKDEIGAGYRVLVDLLSHPGEDGVEMNVASSLWLKEGQPFLDTFLTRSRDDFGAEVGRVNFAEPQTLQTMNEWTKEATGGRIERLLEELEADAAMYVLNAVYFNGAWTKPFSAERTTDGQFRISAEETVAAKMMVGGGRYPYKQEEKFEAIRLPYGQRESAYMTILLPSKGVELSEVAAMLAAEPGLLTEEYDVRQGSIEMPKLRLEYSANVKDALRQAGIKTAFDPARADFSAMTPEPPNLFISKVAHRATLSLDEQGTEAAAATVIEMMAGAAPPDKPFRMKVDRPFIAAIVDRATGCILFAGAVLNPG